jgi:tetratricopeptide (TPR) repeat protein
MSKNSNPTKIIIPIFIILSGFGLIFFLSDFLENRRPPLPEGFEDADLSVEGARLKGFALGFEGLLADWYWMRSLQYIGGKMVKTEGTINLENLRPLNPRLLYPYLNNAADLDPRFITVYSYGAMVLPGIDTRQAVAIVEKGIENNPNEWRLYQHLGFIYWRLKQFDKAAEIYGQGAKIPGAPPFLGLMAAKMRSEGGSRETARSIYRQIYENAADSQTREAAALRLLELDSLDERDAIRAALKNFKEKTGRCATNWREIFPLLQNVKLPGSRDFSIDKSNNLVDPGGAPYILDKENCEVKLDEKTTKIPF